jgi:hypothetical protein
MRPGGGGGVGLAGGFEDGQRVHIGAEGDGWGAVGVGGGWDEGEDAGAAPGSAAGCFGADAGDGFESQGLQFAGDDLAGALLLEHEFGVAVQVVSEGAEGREVFFDQGAEGGHVNGLLRQGFGSRCSINGSARS